MCTVWSIVDEMNFREGLCALEPVLRPLNCMAARLDTDGVMLMPSSGFNGGSFCAERYESWTPSPPPAKKKLWERETSRRGSGTWRDTVLRPYVTPYSTSDG